MHIQLPFPRVCQGRGAPLTDYATVVNRIAKTPTTTGLKVSCRLDGRRYPAERKLSDQDRTKINLHRRAPDLDELIGVAFGRLEVEPQLGAGIAGRRGVDDLAEAR